jgi:hypothetical protein
MQQFMIFCGSFSCRVFGSLKVVIATVPLIDSEMREASSVVPLVHNHIA